VALPGDLAARQPWRNLLAHCLAFVPDWQDYPTPPRCASNWPLLAQAIERGINAPRPRPADGCLMPSPARWAARRSP
jgi:hydrogenase maturation protein HypF